MLQGRRQKFPRRPASGWLILLLGAVAMFLGLQQSSPPLLALGCVLVSAPLLSRFLLRYCAKQLETVREAPRSAFEGDRIEVTVRLTNLSRQGCFFPQVAENFAPEIHADKTLTLSGRLLPSESRAMRYEGFCVLPRGIFLIGPTVLRLCDPLGWFEYRANLQQAQIFKVYPRILPFEADRQLGQCVDFVVNNHIVSGKGLSSEFHSVREYHSGDDPRRIHWGLSARQRHPVVREFSRHATGDVSIILDSHRDSPVGWGRGSSCESMVKIATAISSCALKVGRRVQIISGGGRGLEIHEGEMAGDFQRFLDHLVSFKTVEEKHEIPAVMRQAASVLPDGGVVIIGINPYSFGHLELEKEIRSWVRKRSQVCVVLFDGPAVRGLRARKVDMKDYGRHLRTLGAHVHTVHFVDDLDSELPVLEQQFKFRWRA